MALSASNLNAGDTFTESLVEDLKRTQIVMYAGASGDYNPVHTDEKFTKELAGYPSVFAHGMLTMGMTGSMLTNYVGDGRLTKFGVRFTSQVWPGDSLNATATVEDVTDGIVNLKVETTNQDGVVVLSGLAWCNRQERSVAEDRLLEIVRHNMKSAYNLVEYVGTLPAQRRMVRLGSNQIPMATQPDWRYVFEDKTVLKELERGFGRIGDCARDNDVRISFHPGQFCVLGKW